jgi:cytochrome c peroxidase
VFVVSAAVLWPLRPSASNTLNLPAIPYRYANVELPAHFALPGINQDNTPPDNPLTDAGATLGRVLFYETRLSANNTTSCGSCHLQAHAFADPKPFSRGFHGAFTDRRAMPLVNARYYQRARFFWDERAGNLEEMVLLPIQSRIEMGQDLAQVVNTLARDAAYPLLFARAFGDKQVTSQRIGKALAQFVRAIVSYQSRYDEGRARAKSAQDDFESFTRRENRGKALFLRNCGTCHMKDSNEHFFVPIPANTGLRGDTPKADGGVADATLLPPDLGSFKSPSLRNVEVTAPYGHDGRFATLDALIDHYSDNPIADPNSGYMVPLRPLKFTASEKAALIAFLKTLTDRTLLTDPRFSNPFTDRRDVVKTVRRTVQAAGASLLAAGAAAQQVPAVLRSALLITEVPRAPLSPRLNSGAVIDRLLSLDADGNGKLSRAELPERMQPLVDRGDRNGDADLDFDEIRSLINSAPPQTRRATFRAQPAEGLPGVIKDLKLTPWQHALALDIVSRHRTPRNLNHQANSELHAEMRALLDREDYENFVAAAVRLTRVLRVIIN